MSVVCGGCSFVCVAIVLSCVLWFWLCSSSPSQSSSLPLPIFLNRGRMFNSEKVKLVLLLLNAR